VISEIVEFARARLQEDEMYLRTIKEVGQRQGEQATPEDIAAAGHLATAILADRAARDLLEQWMEGPVPVPNDVDRLLDEIEVKRAILAHHHVADYWSTGMVFPARYRCTCGDPDPCSETRAMVSVWRGHPAYRPGWAL
jgi:hypothetical protein